MHLCLVLFFSELTFFGQLDSYLSFKDVQIPYPKITNQGSSRFLCSLHLHQFNCTVCDNLLKYIRKTSLSLYFLFTCAQGNVRLNKS